MSDLCLCRDTECPFWGCGCARGVKGEGEYATYFIPDCPRPRPFCQEECAYYVPSRWLRKEGK